MTLSKVCTLRMISFYSLSGHKESQYPVVPSVKSFMTSEHFEVFIVLS
jgi:hypothetical protein